VTHRSETRQLLQLSLEEFLDALSATEPEPASGVAAAVVAAMAAEVVAMAARTSADWSDGAGVAAQARALSARLLPLARADAQAFAHVLALRADEAADSRDLGPALQQAAQLPLAIADAAAATAELAALAAAHATGTERADAVAAAALAEGATRAAAALVHANLATVPGDDRSAQADALVRAAAAARTRAQESA
jgi:formiminotetrahydrofolate cyclodeaminase